jgi:uncharacterized protein YndB with AHSA1/START domain
MSDHAKRKGTLTERDGQATITFERVLPHPIEAVWSALTDPVERAAWFGPSAIEGRVGGEVVMTSEGPPAPPEMRRMHGRVLVWDPPRVLEHEWKQTITGDTLVRYELTPVEGGTRLVLTHSRLRPKDARGYIPGQHAFVDRMEAHLAQQALPVWTERYAAVQPLYT